MTQRPPQAKKDVLMYFDLITSIKTTQEVLDLSSEIDRLMSTLSQTQSLSLDKAITAISITTGKKIMQIFEKNDLDVNDSKLTSDFLETLKDLIKKFKVIKLILAFDPPLKTIENIHSFVANEIGIGYVLDVEVSEQVVAGSVVIFNGKYWDFTLRKSLEEVFREKKEEILQSVR